MLRECEVKLFPSNETVKGSFHGWFQDYEQLGSGEIATCVVGIVELKDGSVTTSAPERIKFFESVITFRCMNDRIVSEVRGSVSVSQGSRG